MSIVSAMVMSAAPAPAVADWPDVNQEYFSLGQKISSTSAVISRAATLRFSLSGSGAITVNGSTSVGNGQHIDIAFTAGQTGTIVWTAQASAAADVTVTNLTEGGTVDEISMIHFYEGGL